MSLATLLLLHAIATWAMTGVIWFVQLVHYPLFELADREAFPEFADRHQRTTTWVVAPLMLVEAAAATMLLFAPVDAAPDATVEIRLGWALVVAIWLSTALVQVPLHRRLSAGYDAATIRRLVRSNWIRTVLWSFRALLAALLVAG